MSGVPISQQKDTSNFLLSQINFSPQGILSMSLGFSLILKIKKESVSFGPPCTFLDFHIIQEGDFYVI